MGTSEVTRVELADGGEASVILKATVAAEDSYRYSATVFGVAVYSCNKVVGERHKYYELGWESHVHTPVMCQAFSLPQESGRGAIPENVGWRAGEAGYQLGQRVIAAMLKPDWAYDLVKNPCINRSSNHHPDLYGDTFTDEALRAALYQRNLRRG